MNVEIKYADGTTITPIYEPQYKDSIIAFYTNLVNQPQAKAMAIRITDDNGDLVWFGSAS
jgi:hypothetical protein